MASKSTGQIIGTVVGAVAGFFAGGNVALGAAIGGAIGGAIDPPKGPKIEGPRLDDLKVQTSTYGAIKPRAYGTVMMSGNIFWIEGDQLREVTTTEQQGGKGGGGGSELTSYAYYATFAVGLCKGPVSAIRRLWIGDELVYSAVNAADAGITDAQFAENILASNTVNFTLFNGSDTQAPCARMQADKGVGNVSGYPGEAYLLIEDLNLDKWSNTLVRAQIKAEVVVSAQYAIMDKEISKLPPFKEYAGYGGYIWDINRLIWSVNFDSTGVTIISWLRRDPDGYSVAIEFERQEFPYSKTVTRRDIGRYEMGGGAFHWYGAYVMCQSDEDLLISVQGHVAYPNDFTLGFHGRDGSVWSPTPFTYSGFPGNSKFSVASKGRYFIGGNGKVFEVSPIGIIQYSPFVDIYWMGISDNYLFTLSTNKLGYGTTIVNKLSLVDLSIVATYSQTTYGLASIEVIDDNSFYTIGKSSSGNYIYKWVGGVIVSSELQGTASSVEATKFHIFKASPPQIFYVPRFWEYGFSPGPVIRMVASSIDDSPAKLRDIITAECALGGLASGNIDLTSLTNSDVRGFKIATVSAIRSAFDPLRAAFQFDVCQAGYKVKFISRGGASVTTIDEIELGATEDAKVESLLPVIREMNSQLPYAVAVTFLNSAREYDIDEQYAERLNSRSLNERMVELAIVFTPTEAAKVADILIKNDWIQRTSFGPFSLPPTRLNLEACDVITISHRASSYECRLTSVEYLPDGHISCTAVATSSATYTSSALGEESLVTGIPVVPLAGLSEAILLDIPRIVSTQDTLGISVGLFGLASGWPGATLLRSDDSGGTYVAVASTNTRANVFTTTNFLSSANSYSIDNSAILDVTPEFPGFVLYSITELQLYAHQNLCAYGADGRWEIVAFQIVVDNTGSYTLKNFLRGLYGTEQYTGSHVAGDYLVMLDTATISFFGLPSNAIGSQRLYRAVTQGASIDSVADIVDTYDSANLKPLSPVDPNASVLNRNLTIVAVRRTRMPVEVFSGATVPLGESAESYDLEIYDSTFSTIKRTFSGLSSLSAVYTEAQQITDFGVSISTIYGRWYQNSSVVGRGYPLQFSLTRNAANDPYADYVRLGMHFDGTDQSVVFTDFRNHTITVSGTAKIVVAQSKFGGASGSFNGTAGYIYLDEVIGNADFCMEFWGYFPANVASGYELPIMQYGTSADGADGWALGKAGSSGSLYLRNSYSNIVAIGCSLSAQHHIAIFRSGGSMWVAVDGVSSTALGSIPNMSAVSRIKIGSATATWGQNAQFNIDELRLIVGASVYSSTTFNPPTAAFVY